MNVSAIIVTRGDVELGLVIESIPSDWELLIWNNGEKTCRIYDHDHGMRIPWVREEVGADLAVYGRYAAIEHAIGDLIYVQDDDCIVSDPQAIVDVYKAHKAHRGDIVPAPVVCNQPAQFRYGFYEEHSLVGFGAAFHRDAPARAFQLMKDGGGYVDDVELANRTCDVVFTALTPRILVDIPYENLPWATDETRMYRQAGHQAERGKMLELAFRAKDAMVEV